MLAMAAKMLRLCVVLCLLCLCSAALEKPKKDVISARDHGLENMFAQGDSVVGSVLNQLEGDITDAALDFDPKAVSTLRHPSRVQQQQPSRPVTGEEVVEDVLLNRGIADPMRSVDLGTLEDIQRRYAEGAVLLELSSEDPNTVMSDNDNYVRQVVEGAEEKRWDKEEEAAKLAVQRNQMKRIEAMKRERASRLKEERSKQMEADVKWKKRDDTAREMRQLTADASVKAHKMTKAARQAFVKKQEVLEEHHKKLVKELRKTEQDKKRVLQEQTEKKAKGWGTKEQQLQEQDKKRQAAWNKRQEAEGKALAKEQKAKKAVEQRKKDEQKAKMRLRESLAKTEQRAKARARELKAKQRQRERAVKKRKAEETAKAMEKDKKKREQEERNKFKGLCTFQRTNKPFHSACPSGWKNHGLAGIILRHQDYSRNPFHSGGGFNGGWRWSHPYLCCAETDTATMNGLFVMSKECHGGAKDQGLYGLIMYKGHYSNNPFHNGGGFNSGWTWTHPHVCQVDSNDQANARGNCLMAKQCPKGWQNRGLAGVILLNSHYKMNPFHGGGGYNGGWTWAHPYLCCRP